MSSPFLPGRCGGGEPGWIKILQHLGCGC